MSDPGIPVTRLGDRRPRRAREPLGDLVAIQLLARDRADQRGELRLGESDDAHAAAACRRKRARPTWSSPGRSSAVEIGERPGEAEHAVVAAHRDAAALERAVEDARSRPCAGRRPASAATTPGTCALSRHGVSRSRSAARARAASMRTRAEAELGSVGLRCAIRNCAAVMRRHVQPDVDAIEQRAAEPPEVAPPRERRARAVDVASAGVAARARVRREHELEPRREARGSRSPARS